ncbi:MAG: aldehyde ferredoxin oxidoreductase family protein [Ardenticatenaceae bacterium]|nr:aldehyde ferredoxin oxidoreductase family protein [Ardenticatenaceae bacterium]
MQGWAGKILDINLTDGSINTMPLDMEMARLFLGGRGLGARLLWDLVGPEVKPLSPENALIFTTGPITASASQTSNRFNVSTKSPLTDTILHANSGGWWGMQFKRTGYDALIIRGKAASPVMIEITSDGAEIKDAGHLWGKTVFETTETLSQNRNKRNVLCIGPAGENLVRMSAIMNDKERALARGGGGAVMGSKNLKAIIVEGSEKNKPADPDQFKFLLYETGKLLKASPLTSQALPEFGTAVVMNVVNEIGALPTRNFQQSQFEGADKISGEEITDTILVKNQACWACPISCTRVTKTKSGKEGEGPEFESSWAFGAQLGIDDLDTITEANYLCNDMGLDTISMGNTIGCAMELAEKGFIDSDLAFGQTDKILDLIRDTAYRRDMGNELAEGSYRLALRYEAPELSMSVKKLELPAYDPRGMQGQGLVFATSNRGACHETGNMLGPEVLALPRLIDRFATQGKAGIVSVHQNSAAVIDSLVYCKFANMAVAEEFFARTLTAVTGQPFTADDLMMVGERVWNLERLYNLREGFTKEDDTLPDRLLNEPVAAGPSEGFTVNLAPMLKEYYAFRGWDKNGVPKPEKLKELSLEFAMEMAND